MDTKTQNESIVKELRLWESSKDVSHIYQIINKNRKLIKDKANDFIIKNCILNDNLVKLLKEMFPEIKLSNTQWKMIVAIGDKDKTGQVKLDLFFNLVTNSAKSNISHPKII